MNRERTIESERFATYNVSLGRSGHIDAGQKIKVDRAGMLTTGIVACLERSNGGNNRAGHIAAFARHARA